MSMQDKLTNLNCEIDNWKEEQANRGNTNWHWARLRNGLFGIKFGEERKNIRLVEVAICPAAFAHGHSWKWSLRIVRIFRIVPCYTFIDFIMKMPQIEDGTIWMSQFTSHISCFIDKVIHIAGKGEEKSCVVEHGAQYFVFHSVTRRI